MSSLDNWLLQVPKGLSQQYLVSSRWTPGPWRGKRAVHIVREENGRSPGLLSTPSQWVITALLNLQPDCFWWVKLHSLLFLWDRDTLRAKERLSLLLSGGGGRENYKRGYTRTDSWEANIFSDKLWARGLVYSGTCWLLWQANWGFGNRRRSHGGLLRVAKEFGFWYHYWKVLGNIFISSTLKNDPSRITYGRNFHSFSPCNFLLNSTLVTNSLMSYLSFPNLLLIPDSRTQHFINIYLRGFIGLSLHPGNHLHADWSY